MLCFTRLESVWGRCPGDVRGKTAGGNSGTRREESIGRFGGNRTGNQQRERRGSRSPSLPFLVSLSIGRNGAAMGHERTYPRRKRKMDAD